MKPKEYDGRAYVTLQPPKISQNTIVCNPCRKCIICDPPSHPVNLLKPGFMVSIQNFLNANITPSSSVSDTMGIEVPIIMPVPLLY